MNGGKRGGFRYKPKVKQEQEDVSVSAGGPDSGDFFMFVKLNFHVIR